MVYLFVRLEVFLLLLVTYRYRERGVVRDWDRRRAHIHFLLRSKFLGLNYTIIPWHMSFFFWDRRREHIHFLLRSIFLGLNYTIIPWHMRFFSCESIYTVIIQSHQSNGS